MDISEIASQLTMKALETGAIVLVKGTASLSNPQAGDKANEFNMKAVGNFYKEMVDVIDCVSQPEK